MSRDRGKQFEGKFKEDFSNLQGSLIDRLYDPVGTYYGIRNCCDFIGYVYPFIFYIECKSVQGNTFPLSNLTQYEELMKKAHKRGANPGVIIWFIDHKKIAWVSIEEFDRIKSAGYKSINVKMIGDPEFNVVEVPTVAKRIALDANYSVLISEAEKKLLAEFGGKDE